METTLNQKDRKATAQDRQTEEWLVGFRIGLVLAEQGMSEIMQQGGYIEVLDADRKVVFASRIRELVMLAEGEGSRP